MKTGSMTKPTCQCADLPDAVSAGNRFERQAFLQGLEKVEESLEYFLELYRCRVCAQRWRFDILNVPLHAEVYEAIKIPGSVDWKAFDSRPAIRELRIRQCGGESDRECAWAGCTLPALNEMEVCVEHTYPYLAAQVPDDAV